MKRILLVLLAVCLLLASPLSIHAQFETAVVLGYVRDSSGAVVSAATVSLVNQETKTQVTAQTDAQGAYQFTDVKIGQYQVTAQANGFGTSTTQLLHGDRKCSSARRRCFEDRLQRRDRDSQRCGGAARD